MYRLDGDRAIVETVDFFTPVVDDPYWFGRIAAANAFSDVWAMGGRPLLALNVVGWPVGKLPMEMLGEVLRGGADAVIFPADDGGYVLIGLRQPVPQLFTGMPWSTDGVMLATRQRLRQLGLSWREPGQLWDVDRPSDVMRMRREGLTDLLAGIDPRTKVR